MADRADRASVADLFDPSELIVMQQYDGIIWTGKPCFGGLIVYGSKHPLWNSTVTPCPPLTYEMLEKWKKQMLGNDLGDTPHD